jgi:hypothetical protein
VRWIFVLLLTIPFAVVGWSGVYEVIQNHPPAEAGALMRFYAYLALALSATVAPLVAYLNRRFSADASRRNRLRFVRQSVWCGLCLTSWAWLQMQRAFNLAFALLIAIVFVAVELLFVRLKTKP